MTKKVIVPVLFAVFLLVAFVLIQWKLELNTTQEGFKPLTPKDVIRLPPLKRFIVNAMVQAVRFFGRWNYPHVTDGDFPNMTFVDKLYWFYKTQYPVCRGERGRNLEASFAKNRLMKISFPSGFIPEQTITLSAVSDLMQHVVSAHTFYIHG